MSMDQVPFGGGADRAGGAGGAGRRYRKALIRGLAASVLLLAGLFGLAGRLDYWQGWAFTATCVVGISVSTLVFRTRGDLVVERMSPGPGTKAWDKVFWALYLPAFLAVFAVGSLDGGRYGWTKQIPAAVYAAAWVVFVLSILLTQWAKWINRFFSTVVRIQSERGHAVVQEGPYRVVRHPGYVAGILMALSIPVVLGSYWGLVPGALVVALLVARTHLEDRALRAELPGYRDYAAKVRYRLLPGVW